VVVDLCHFCKPGREDSGRVVAVKPAGSNWSPAERGEDGSPLRVRTLDVSDEDLAYLQSGQGDLYYRDGRLVRVALAPAAPVKG
jgi:hypothetical protein